jgi:hypothetical protein
MLPVVQHTLNLIYLVSKLRLEILNGGPLHAIVNLQTTSINDSIE